MNKLKLQTQPTPVSCQHTCAAMIVGMPVEVLFDPEELDECATDSEIAKVMMNHGIYAATNYGSSFLYGNLYLCKVPSLNIEMGFHAVLVDARDKDNVYLLDPNQGREGKKYYTTEDINKMSFSADLRIHYQDDSNFRIGPV